MLTFRSHSLHSIEILRRKFQTQLRQLGQTYLPHDKAAERRYRARLRQLGFEKPHLQFLARLTPGAAIRTVSEGSDLRQFFQQVEQIGLQLAKSNLKPKHIALALREYNDAIADILRRTPKPLPPGLKSLLDQLQFGIILSLNHAYYTVRETETQALFDLYRASADALDEFALLRSFVESISSFFGASAGHLFVLNRDQGVWELKASTAVAVTPETKGIVAARAQRIQKLHEAREIANRTERPSPLVLDTGWNKQWEHCWSLPMFLRNRLEGVLQLAFGGRRSLLHRDASFAAQAGEQTLVATERTRLIEDIADREQQMFDLARRLLQVEEIERRRISRELHDDAGQSLVVIRLQLEMIEQSMPPDAEWRERLAEARDLTETTILHMRRLIADLSPAVLEQLGVAAGLRQLVNRLRNRYPCKVRLHIGKLPPLFSDFQIIVYRLVQECLNNISTHSRAKNVNISVTSADRVLRLHVEDDGVGFRVEEGLSKKQCFGLVGMRERVALLGGSCQIRSTPKNRDVTIPTKNTGTQIDIRLPIPVNFPSTATQDVVR